MVAWKHSRSITLVRTGQMHRHACALSAHTHLTCLIKTHPTTETQTCECFPWGAGRVHFEKGRRLNIFFPFLAYNYRDCWNAWPWKKAGSWESPTETSPSSVLLSIVSLPSWMPPTPGMSEVEVLSPEAPTSQTPEAEWEKKSRSRATESIALWARRCSLIANWLKKEQKLHGELTITRHQSWQARREFCFPTSLLSKLSSN